VQCDVTRLPFASQTLDGIVSLHTIYHVPADEQKKALSELFRTLAPGKQAVVVYSFARYSWLLKLLGIPAKVYRGSRKAVGDLLRAIKVKPTLTDTPQEQHGKLYFFPHGYHWFKEQIRPNMPFTLHTWRSVTVTFTRSSIHPRLLGKFWLSFLYRLEEWFPRWFGKNGAYPMFVFKKPPS
jgi:SAM-dependent methyltransferase